jgi:RNA polymerase sigma-70 factor, ECF subfamily
MEGLGRGGNSQTLMISDETLMLEFQRGSRAAFEELFQRYREPIYGFFRRRLHSQERAEDLTQDTFVAVIRGLLKYEPKAHVRSYLYGIALKVLANERRKLARDLNRHAVDCEPVADDPLDSAVWVRQAMEKLDDSEREIVMLREYEQLTYAEIAELLHIPVNTVRSRLFRSRMVLKQYLQPSPEQSVDSRGDLCP